MTKVGFTIVAVAGLSFASCNHASSEHGDAPVVSDAAMVGDAAVVSDAATDALLDSGSDLPAPAIDTVEMRLNGTRVTLVEKQSCENGLSGIGFRRTAVDDKLTPTLGLEDIDLSGLGDIVIKSGRPWHTDIGDNRITWGPAEPGCRATITELSATTVELGAADCAIKSGDQTGTVSFRVRCIRTD